MSCKADANLCRRLTWKNVAKGEKRAIMELLSNQLPKIKMFSFLAQEKRWLEELGHGQTVVSGNAVFKRGPKGQFFRLNLERLMTAFVDSVKEIHAVDRKDLAKT